METKRNNSLALQRYLFVAIFILTLFSCHPPSYMDLLTGGDVKYWSVGEPLRYYRSFNQNTHRVLDYDEDFKVSYMNGMDYLSRGQFFKIEGNKILRSWAIRCDTFPIDTFIIVCISKKRLVLFKHGSVHPVTYRYVRSSKINGKHKMSLENIQ